MSCVNSRRLSILLATNKKYINAVQPLLDKIEGLKAISPVSKEHYDIIKSEIKFQEDIVEYSILSNFIKDSPVYRASVINKRKGKLVSVDLLDNISGLLNSGLNTIAKRAGVKGIEDMVIQKVARDITNSPYKSLLNKDISGVKTIQELKSLLKIDSSLINILPGDNVRDVFDKLVLLRELLSGDKKFAQEFSKLGYDGSTKEINKIVRSIDSDKFMSFILANIDKISNKYFRKEVYDRANIIFGGNKFVNDIVDGITKSKNINQLIDYMEGIYKPKARKELEGIFTESIEGAKYYDDEASREIGSIEAEAASIASTDSIKAQSVPLGPSPDVVTNLSDLNNGDVILIRKETLRKKIEEELKSLGKDVKVIAPIGKESRNIFVSDGKLYVGFENKGEYIRYKSIYGGESAISDDIAEQSALNAYRIRYGNKEALIEYAKKQSEGRQYLETAVASELFLKMGGDRLETIIDEGEEFYKWSQKSDIEILQELENILPGASVDTVDDELRNILFDIKFGQSPEKIDSLKLALAEKLGQVYTPEYSLLEAFNFINKLQSEGFAVPPISDVVKYIDFLKGETNRPGTFINDLFVKNDISNIGGVIGDTKYQELLDKVNSFFERVTLRATDYTIPTSRGGAKKVFIPINTTVRDEVVDSIVNNVSKGLNYKEAIKEFNADMEQYKSIISKYQNKLKTMLGGSEFDMYKLKLEYQIAIDAAEREIGDKYRGFMGNNDSNFLKTKRYDIWKAVDKVDYDKVSNKLSDTIQQINKIQERVVKNIQSLEIANRKNFRKSVVKKNGKYIGGNDVIIRDVASKLIDNDLKEAARKMDISNITPEETHNLSTVLLGVDEARRRSVGRILKILNTIDPGFADLFLNYQLVQSGAGEVPKKLLVTTNGLNKVLDQEYKARIIEGISSLLDKGKTLDEKSIEDVVTGIIDPTDAQYIDGYIKDFMPYTSAYNIPNSLTKYIDGYKFTDAERAILEKVVINGTEGDNTLLHYIERSPEAELPRITTSKKQVFQEFKGDTTEIEKQINNIDISSNELEDAISDTWSAKARGVLQKYSLTRVINAIDRLQRFSPLAHGAINNITTKTLGEVQDAVREMMEMGDKNFKKLEYALEKDIIKSDAYKIASYFREMREIAYDNNGIGITKIPEVNEAIANAYNNFLSMKQEDRLVNGRYLSKNIKSNRILSLTEIDFGDSDTIKGLVSGGKLKYGHTNNEKNITTVTNILFGTDMGDNNARRVFEGLGTYYGGLDRLVQGLDNLGPLGNLAKRSINQRVLQRVAGFAKGIYSPIYLSQIPAYFIKKSSLRAATGATKSDMKVVSNLMQRYGLGGFSGVRGLNELRNNIDIENETVAKLYEDIIEEFDGNPGFFNILHSTTLVDKIKKLGDQLSLSPSNAIEMLFVHDNRALHVLQAIKNNKSMKFSSVNDFVDFLTDSKIAVSTKEKILENIDIQAQKTFLDDNGLIESGIDEVNLAAGLGEGKGARILGTIIDGLRLPQKFLAGRGDNVTASLARSLQQTGVIGKYLIQNGFSDESKRVAEQRVKNHPEWKHLWDQLARGAWGAVQLNKRILGKDDDNIQNDYIQAMNYLVMPLQGLQVGSVWKTYEPLVTALFGDSDDAINMLKRNFAEARIATEITKSIGSIIKSNNPGDIINIIGRTLETLGGGGVRFILDDTERSFSNSYIAEEKLSKLQGILGMSFSRDRKFYYDELNRQERDKLLSDPTNILPLFGGGITQFIQLIGGITGLNAKQKNVIANNLGTPKEFLKLYSRVGEFIDANGKLKTDTKVITDYAIANFEGNLKLESSPENRIYNSMKYYFLTDKDGSTGAANVKDREWGLILETIEKNEGRAELRKFADMRMGKLGSGSDNEKRQSLLELYKTLRDKEYRVPGLNVDMIQTLKRLEYDRGVEDIKNKIKESNKSLGLKGKDKDKIGSFAKDALKVQIRKEYVQELEDNDRQAYNDLISDILIQSNTTTTLSKYVTKDKTGKVILLPKYYEMASKELQYRNDIAKGKLEGVFAGRDSLLNRLNKGLSSTEDIILQTQRIMNYIDQSDYSDIEKFNAKTEVFLQQKKLIDDPDKVIAVFGNDSYDALVSHWYGLYNDGLQIANELDNAIESGNDKEYKSVGGGGGGGGGKSNIKFSSNFKGLKEIIGKHAGKIIDTESLPKPIKLSSLDNYNISRKGGDIQYQGVSSSISRIDQKSTKPSKDIKRVFTVKKTKGPKKLKQQAL